MAKAKNNILKKLKSLKKLSTPKILVISALTVFAGLVVGVVYGATQSDDCVIGQVGYYYNEDAEVETSASGSCSTGSSSGGSSSGGSSSGGNTGGTQAVTTGALVCATRSSSAIRWSASWRNAKSEVVMFRGGDIIHRFRRADGPSTGRATWIEEDLGASTSYAGRIRHDGKGLATDTCKTRAATVAQPEQPERDDEDILSGPRDDDGNVVDVFCPGRICTKVEKGRGSQGVSTTSTGRKVVTTPVCKGNDCVTYTTQADTAGVTIAESQECKDGDCVYRVYESTEPTGVRGFFVRLYLQVNGFFRGLI